LDTDAFEPVETVCHRPELLDRRDALFLKNSPSVARQAQTVDVTFHDLIKIIRHLLHLLILVSLDPWLRLMLADFPSADEDRLAVAADQVAERPDDRDP
jgi:hypothetical protein